jgi:hypothetical protein
MTEKNFEFILNYEKNMEQLPANCLTWKLFDENLLISDVTSSVYYNGNEYKSPVFYKNISMSISLNDESI